ncbi:polysaccharide export outer membrane protein [Ekhidna lutea]|uniref:Polysaccharide export outer membrane protein n=1 Tax=Ekhidna lutea TaxID=447679 RepID=A0A239KFF8_EKHLU|nr:polysaccharide biosynthesis/export family protein [Ekhidna lutea]SNT16911.1 polysaccharide export outer membrane protein [Ekhidna lutea]
MNRLVFIILIAVLSSCKAYKQDIMFRFDDEFTEEDLSKVTDEVEGNYELKRNDILLLDVFTHNGERLIDPNLELVSGPAQQQQQFKDRFQYVIQSDGIVTFPMIGNIELAGMTLFAAENKVAEKFDDVYKGSFVKLRITNRRVFVLGAPGGKVIPLQNENTNLVEVLASAEGLDLGSKAQNIRLVRGDDVYQINLATISGMKKTNMIVEPGDIIYIEPWRRPWLETLRDVSPALSLVSSVLTLIVVVQNL